MCLYTNNNDMTIDHDSNDTIDCKPQSGDFVGNVEVILTNDNDQKNNDCSIREGTETAKRLNFNHNDDILSEGEKASEILRFIELMNSNNIPVHKNNLSTQKTLPEKCYDTRVSMKELDLFLEKGSCRTRTFSSPTKNHDRDLVETMRFIWDFKNLSQSQEKHSYPGNRTQYLDNYTAGGAEINSRKGPTKVSFHKDVVTNVSFFHPVSIADRKDFFYTSNETRQFRVEYMQELRNKMDEHSNLDGKGVEVWDAVQYYSENFVRYLFPDQK